jgi:hypothetical protein
MYAPAGVKTSTDYPIPDTMKHGCSAIPASSR